MTNKKVIFLFAATILLLSLAFIPFEYSSFANAANKTMDAGHFIAFGFFGLLLQYIFTSHKKSNPTTLSFAICAVLIISIEILQPYVGRMASFNDVINGFLGLITFLSGRLIWRSTKSIHIRYIHTLLGTLIFTTIANPALSEWNAVWWQMQHFPVLGDFEKTIELKLWQANGKTADQQTHISLNNKHVAFGKSALKVETIQGAWSGVEYFAGDKDWSIFDDLNMNIYNPGSPFFIHIRIDDNRKSPDYSERFNRTIPLSNGWNQIQIALVDIANGAKINPLNMHAIHKLLIFTSKEEANKIFYLDNIQLK